jgi:non-ribosomal peptide synthetase component E (peptide arylation enzyme)
MEGERRHPEGSYSVSYETLNVGSLPALDGFRPYDPSAAALYAERRWWLGSTVGDMFDKSSDLYPRKEALVGWDGDGAEQRYTYAELRRRVDGMAFSMLRAGFVPGDRVLLQLPNWPEFVIAYFALQKAGLVMVLLTVNHTAREVAHLARLTQPAGWIVPGRYRKTDYAPLIDQVRQDVPAMDKVIVVGDPVPSGCLSFAGLQESGTGADADEIRIVLEAARPEPAAVCQILPSGGTTGLPKGAPRTHDDYICNVEYTSKAWDLNVTDRVLVGTTVGHNLALLVCVTAAVFHGAGMVVLDSTRPEDFCRVVQDEGVTAAALVPTLMSRIAVFDGLADYDLSALHKVYVGAANSPPDLVRAVERGLGVRYTNAFGMVEGPCSQSRPDDPEEIVCNTIGRPVCPYDDLVTLDAAGAKTGVGVEGELAARGPGIFMGYFNNPAANQQAFTPDGYFRTGDLAVIDERGVIRITGRLKDIIIRGGENIAARDVEDLISAHPGVEYVAVVGLPDADLGEAVCAVIKPRTGTTIDHVAIVAFMEDGDAPRKFIPARTEIVEAIPLTAAGKADKKVLKQQITERLAGNAGGGEKKA